MKYAFMNEEYKVRQCFTYDYLFKYVTNKINEQILQNQTQPFQVRNKQII
jgi:hypothetical protein